MVKEEGGIVDGRSGWPGEFFLFPKSIHPPINDHIPNPLVGEWSNLIQHLLFLIFNYFSFQLSSLSSSFLIQIFIIFIISPHFFHFQLNTHLQSWSCSYACHPPLHPPIFLYFDFLPSIYSHLMRCLLLYPSSLPSLCHFFKTIFQSLGLTPFFGNYIKYNLLFF